MASYLSMQLTAPLRRPVAETTRLKKIFPRLPFRDRRDNPKDPSNLRKSTLELGGDRNANVCVVCRPA